MVRLTGGAQAARRAERVRRGMFLLPSLFTAGSIGLGYYAITQTIDSVGAIGNTGAQRLDWAAIAICVAIPFDALDGRIARLTNTASDFGRELDSLADAITFGVAPALLAFVWGFHWLPEAINPELRRALIQIGSFVCFLYLLCGVSRLARFNISHAPEPSPVSVGRHERKYFVGMPIPAAAGLVAATVHCCNGAAIPEWWLAALWIALVGLLGFLMVSTWRFWSGKEINLSRTQPFQLLALLAIFAFVLIRFSRGALFVVALVYMFSGIWARAAYSWSRRRRHLPRFAEEEQVVAPAGGARFADAYAEQMQEHGVRESWEEVSPAERHEMYEQGGHEADAHRAGQDSRHDDY